MKKMKSKKKTMPAKKKRKTPLPKRGSRSATSRKMTSNKKKYGGKVKR